MSEPTIDLEQLLKLRFLTRFRDLGLAKWWNAKGQPGPLGAAALGGGFPRTYRFAHAPSVFKLAAHHCAGVLEAQGCVTLWRLPDVAEETFETRWEHWADHASEWAGFFKESKALGTGDRTFEVASRRGVKSLGKLRRAAEGRAGPLPGLPSRSDADVASANRTGVVEFFAERPAVLAQLPEQAE
jgi:hypothetical protein